MNKTLFAIVLIVTMAVGLYALTNEPIKLSVEEGYHARAIAAERDKAKAESERESLWVQAAINQFVEGNAQVKQHRDLANSKDQEYQGKLKEYQELETKLLTDHGAVEQAYTLDPVAGVLAPKRTKQ